MIAALGEHAGFILAAYGFVAVVLAIIIIATWRDGLQQKRALADLEARGIRRRSDNAATGSSA